MAGNQRVAFFRFYSHLNELLPKYRRFQQLPVAFKGRQSVKHLIESLGVPHTEVDLVLVNGKPKRFSYIPRNAERVSVYPRFVKLPMPAAIRLQPEDPQILRFSADGHLGQLVRYLRMLGFDTYYRNNVGDAELAEIAEDQQRILLTRDRGLLKRKAIKQGYLIRQRDPRQQLLSVVRRYNLMAISQPFTRCMVCNGKLISVQKEAIMDRLEPKTKVYFQEFKQCAACRKIYWAGSHHAHLCAIIAWLDENA